MPKKLVVVESPAKAKTVGKMLGSGYQVKASLGHVRDLPKSGRGGDIGVDTEHGFAPKYVVPREKQAVVKELKSAANSASMLYLATDPDREGEAIAWHLLQAIGRDGDGAKRVVFHEITREAVQQAFSQPRGIDMNLVNAQQARRVVDRLVGYKISPLLWKKVRKGLSAGRVQSVAVRLVVDREREIQSFVPTEYWSIEAELARLATGPSFRASLVGRLGTKAAKLEIANKEQANAVVADLETASYTVAQVKRKDVARQPAPPFITSTLQQEAWRKLRFTAKQTMAIAQQLYEGLPLGDQGSVGLITYMRTDSTRVATSAQAEVRAYIKEKYGPQFLPPRPRQFTKKVKGAQEAHEAIRPTSIQREPALVKPYLNSRQLKLYELVWKRMLASQMAAAISDTVTVDIEAKPQDTKPGYLLRVSSSTVKFAGFLTIYSEGRDEDEAEAQDKAALPELRRGQGLELQGLFPEQHFTQPPPRYTEATLVKVLEEKGIGRPSTYAPILSTIQERGYVEKVEGKFHPLELGELVNDLLMKHFPSIVDVGFTAQMEEELDDIARGELKWTSVVGKFYAPLDKMLTKAAANIKKVEQLTDEVCDKCGKPMVIKWGRFGKFLACTGYPQCKNARPINTPAAATNTPVTEPATDEVCDKCGQPMVVKLGRFGKFLACSGYPRCRNTRPLNAKSAPAKVGVACPECGGELVERMSKRKQTFYGCAHYPRCRFTTSRRPLPQPCPNCGGLLTLQGKGRAKCIKCNFSGELAELGGEPAAVGAEEG